MESGAAPGPLAPPPLLLHEGGERYLQAGAYSARPVAESLAARLRDLGVEPVRVTETVRNGKPIYRVRIGPVDPGAADGRLVGRHRHRTPGDVGDGLVPSRLRIHCTSPGDHKGRPYMEHRPIDFTHIPGPARRARRNKRVAATACGCSQACRGRSRCSASAADRPWGRYNPVPGQLPSSTEPTPSSGCRNRSRACRSRRDSAFSGSPRAIARAMPLMYGICRSGERPPSPSLN